MAEELDPQWEITVSVPHRLPVEMRQDLFEAVAQAVARWEPVQRDGWDADVFGCPARDRLSYRESQELLWLHAEAVWNHHLALLEIARTNSAWREVVEQWERGHQDVVLPYTAQLETEVERLRREVEFEARGADNFSGADRVYDEAQEKTPDEWCGRFDVTVHGPDGWRRDGKSWDEPITQAEFWQRVAWSSCTMPVHPDGAR